MVDWLKKYRRIVLLIISGFFTAFPLVFPRFGFLQWISVVPAAIILLDILKEEQVKKKTIYGYGVIFFFCYYLVVYHWFLSMYPLDFAGISRGASLVVVIVAWIGLSLLQTVGSALIFVVIYAMSGLRILKNHKLFLPIVAGAIWSVFEWSQTIGWWGVPWGRLALGQVRAPIFLKSSSVLGSYFVTFAIIAVNFYIAYAIANKHKKRIFCALAGLVFTMNLIIGMVATAVHQNRGDSVRVAAIQGNISSSEKWNEGSLDKTLGVYARHTRNAARDGAELIVWPETAIPYNFFNNDHIVTFISELAKECNVTILLSTFTEYQGNPDQLHNSIIQAMPDGSFGREMYFKQRLVPFGEFVPMRDLITKLIPPLASIGMLEEDLIAGVESTVIPTQIGNVGCGICFDSIYEEVIRESALNGAELIAISTNDSWFGDSAALYMHNSQSLLRSIETGKYIVRSANTGISSIISPDGVVMQELSANIDGYVIDDVYLQEKNTVYTHIGNLFVYVCIVLIMGVYACNYLCKTYKRIVKK